MRIHVQSAGNHKTLLILLYLMFYSYKDTKEESYAVAINLPRNQCQGNFDPLNENFLTQENATCVRNAIFKTKNKFYKGEDLMAAGPCLCDCKKSENCTSKSVSVLLKNYSFSTFKKFLQRRENDSCVVIYTVYSPCQKMSDMQTTGIKAFVFQEIWPNDLLWEGSINNLCYKCGDADNENHCLTLSLLFLFN
uniref:Uncharacterized protein n=1 Tax=Sinocyclocheilus anshuiensis TaxID=1608454 RepID=A0A671PC71_9TELE